MPRRDHAVSSIHSTHLLLLFDEAESATSVAMTVIAGASLFNGVILLADTRVTIGAAGMPNIVCDIAQKLVPLTPTTAIGFCGDGRAASFIVQGVLRHLATRSRKDAVSLRLWLPRFIRAAYVRYSKSFGAPPLSFMVGSVIPYRSNMIERAKVADLLNTIGFGRSPIKRNFVPDIVMRILMRPAAEKHVAVRVPAGLLYTMTSPRFEPRHYAPLDYCAIGSGNGSVQEIASTADWLLAGEPGNDMIESMALREAVSEFVASEGIESVGGMYPCIKVDHRGLACLGMGMGVPPDRVSLKFDASLGRWVQHNEATGKRIALRLPWEIDPRRFGRDQRFDDWQEAVRRFNPRRLKRKSS
jgi:hypothetical protein